MRYATQAGLITQEVWQFFPVELEFEVVLPQGEVFKYSSVQGDGVGKGIYWKGLEWLGGEFIIFYNLSKTCDLILDIGANTGIFTLIACAANRAAKVIAFEPVASVNERLVTNVILNMFENRCEIRQEVLSDRVGPAKFFVPLGLIPVQATLDPLGSARFGIPGLANLHSDCRLDLQR